MDIYSIIEMGTGGESVIIGNNIDSTWSEDEVRFALYFKCRLSSVDEKLYWGWNGDLQFASSLTNLLEANPGLRYLGRRDVVKIKKEGDDNIPPKTPTYYFFDFSEEDLA